MTVPDKMFVHVCFRLVPAEILRSPVQKHSWQRHLVSTRM